MFAYLHQRELDEMYRTSTRTLILPNGTAQTVDAFRIVWVWFDRCVAYEFGPTETELVAMTAECAQAKKLPFGEALGKILDHVIWKIEKHGGDFTDDDLVRLAAWDGLAENRKRKARRG